MQEDDIREYWSYCGEIEEMDLMRFPDTGRFKGIAFITFKTVQPVAHQHNIYVADQPAFALLSRFDQLGHGSGQIAALRHNDEHLVARRSSCPFAAWRMS